jgi:hypothetical protein
MRGDVTFGPLTQRLVNEAEKLWGDLYPAWQSYANECERLLTFAQTHGELNRFWTRLCSPGQKRDEALNELHVAYFLESAGFPLIHWEVTDAAPYNVEFAVSVGEERSALVEVKSPGWEGELSMQERLQGRTKQEKYIDTEARVADPVGVIRRTVTKALPKFSGTVPSLIVISDDCFVNLGEWGWGPPAMALTQRSIGCGPGLFHDAAYAVIGAVCLFWLCRVNEAGVHYASRCVTNPNAQQSAMLPAELVARMCTVPGEPTSHLFEPGIPLRF